MSKKKQVKISTKKQIEFDILCTSLVGNNIKIVDSRNKNQIGLEGVLEYESANLFYLKIGDSVKKILKNSVVIEFEMDTRNQKISGQFEQSSNSNKKFQVNGAALLGNIVSRIKKIK